MCCVIFSLLFYYFCPSVQAGVVSKRIHISSQLFWLTIDNWHRAVWKGFVEPNAHPCLFQWPSVSLKGGMGIRRVKLDQHNWHVKTKQYKTQEDIHAETVHQQEILLDPTGSAGALFLCVWRWCAVGRSRWVNKSVLLIYPSIPLGICCIFSHYFGYLVVCLVFDH